MKDISPILPVVYWGQWPDGGGCGGQRIISIAEAIAQGRGGAEGSRCLECIQKEGGNKRNIRHN